MIMCRHKTKALSPGTHSRDRTRVYPNPLSAAWTVELEMREARARARARAGAGRGRGCAGARTPNFIVAGEGVKYLLEPIKSYCSVGYNSILIYKNLNLDDSGNNLGPTYARPHAPRARDRRAGCRVDEPRGPCVPVPGAVGRPPRARWGGRRLAAHRLGAFVPHGPDGVSRVGPLCAPAVRSFGKTW